MIRNTKIYSLTVFSLLVFYPLVIDATEPAKITYRISPFIRNFSKSEYGGANQNWSASQDSEGFFYFGNTFGLLEFNGNNRRLYPSRGNTPIRSVFADSDGKIYYGTYTKTAEGDSIGSIPNDLKALIDRYNSTGRGCAYAYFFKTYVPFKSQTIGRYRYGGYNNINIFRYADALLLYSEALIHKNGAGAGDAPLNLVRARAGMPPLSGATIDNIIDERAVELEFEWGADRFFDLVRLDKAAGTIPKFVKGVHEFFPIPQTQLDLQLKLKEPPVPGIVPPDY